MDPITNNLTTNTLFPAPSADPIPSDNYDPTLATFEQMVDHIVLNEQKNSQAVEQAAIQKAQQLAALQEKIAFLTGAVHQAETALAGVSPSSPPPVDTPSDPALATEAQKAFALSQVAYWKAKLTQAGIPDGTTGLQ